MSRQVWVACQGLGPAQIYAIHCSCFAVRTMDVFLSSNVVQVILTCSTTDMCISFFPLRSVFHLNKKKKKKNVCVFVPHKKVTQLATYPTHAMIASPLKWEKPSKFRFCFEKAPLHLCS